MKMPNNHLSIQRFRNQLASSSLVTGVQRNLSSLFESSPEWRKNRLDTVDLLTSSTKDGYCPISKGGRFRWDSLGVRCINSWPTELPWWWFRDFAYPELSLILLNNALAFREDSWIPDPPVVVSGDVWSSDGYCLKETFRGVRLSHVSRHRSFLNVQAKATFKEGTYLYLGWLSRHYGHFLLESLSRLWPFIATGMDVSAVGLAGFVMEGDTLNEEDAIGLPRFLLDVVGRFGIDLSRVHLIRGACKIREAHRRSAFVFYGAEFILYTAAASKRVGCSPSGAK